MKITKELLKKIIKEEIQTVLKEDTDDQQQDGAVEVSEDETSE